MPTRAAISKLKRDMIVLGEMCENALSTAIMALIDRSEEMALSIIEYDREIDEMELAVDSDCLRLLREGNLEGEPLRFVAAAMKISSEMERIGDNAVEICQHVLFLVRQRTVLTDVVDFPNLIEQVGQMMRESIRALVELDKDLAWKIMDEHLVVEDEVAIVTTELMTLMHDRPASIERCCHILAVCKALERVGDLSTNIAEEVIYLVDGTTVRHHIKELHPIGKPIFFTGDDGDGEEVQKTEEKLVKRHTRRIQKRRAAVKKS